MKKMIFALALAQAFTTVAHASANEIGIYRVCELVAESKLPGGCTATCDKSPRNDNTIYRLTLKKGSQKTSVEVGLNERGERTIVNNNLLKIKAGEKGTNPSIDLSADSDSNILEVSVNEIECK